MTEIGRIFEGLYENLLEKHRSGGIIQDLRLEIKDYCDSEGELELWIEIRIWFKPERYGIRYLFEEKGECKPIPIDDVPYANRNEYYWYPILWKYNQDRLGIIEREIVIQGLEELRRW